MSNAGGVAAAVVVADVTDWLSTCQASIRRKKIF